MVARSNISQGGRHGRLPAHITACAVASIAFSAVAGAAWAQNLPPSYGMRTLSTGDGGQFTIDLQAGGYIDANQVLGPGCVGMVAEAPDFRLQLQGSGSVMLDTSVASTADTTLVISTPDGQWLCNDDAEGVNPAIEIPTARAGLYDIWVGTFSAGGLPQASLTVAAETRDDDRLSETPESESTVAVEAPEDTGWWYSMDGERVGPVAITEIETAITESDVTPDTLVWREGMDEWSAASSVEAVDDLFPVEPPPLPTAASEDEEEEADPAMPPPLPPALPESDEAETDAVSDDEEPEAALSDDAEAEGAMDKGAESSDSPEGESEAGDSEAGDSEDGEAENEAQPAKPATED